MATVSFLWHLHQPAYRTRDLVSHAPWVALHAGGAYTTLARAVLETGGRGQVLNIVPTLLEQLLAYREGTVHDPVIDTLTRPAQDLTDSDVAILLEWAGHVNARHLERSPRLRELAARIATHPAEIRTDRDELQDLQVTLMLAHAGDQAWRDPRLSPLAGRGRDFDDSDHDTACSWLRAQPGELVELWRRVAGLPGVEIATSPYAHPILPLLIDTSVVEDSWSPDPPPKVPRFRYPEDAHRHLVEGLDFMTRNGFSPVGCWPPEGAVSADALAVYAEHGVRWVVTDEGILERSLGQPLRTDNQVVPSLYEAWQLEGRSPVLLFRDRVISDRIGFEFGRWDDESAAAAELVRQLVETASELPTDAAIVIALDGENAWPHYPQAGGDFLRELMDRLNHAGPEIEPATLSEVSDRSPISQLPRLHPGSWIHAIFATWIGHPEKTAAWSLLASVRSALGDRRLPESMLLAEGSDWFWWLGDDNPTELAPLYDAIFRRHLADACQQAGIDPPVDLSKPLKTPV
jgi:alpha-amylase/alpha-mannosidase (GH57 family)